MFPQKLCKKPNRCQWIWPEANGNLQDTKCIAFNQHVDKCEVTNQEINLQRIIGFPGNHYRSQNDYAYHMANNRTLPHWILVIPIDWIFVIIMQSYLNQYDIEGKHRQWFSLRLQSLRSNRRCYNMMWYIQNLNEDLASNVFCNYVWMVCMWPMILVDSRWH